MFLYALKVGSVLGQKRQFPISKKRKNLLFFKWTPKFDFLTNGAENGFR